MIQGIIVVLIFVAALSYLGRVIYKQFQGKSACASGCGKCAAIDLKKIEARIETRQ